MANFTQNVQHTISVSSSDVYLDGLLYIPTNAIGLVLFVHGSGSGRFSKRNQYVANALNKANIATLLFDLLTPDEDLIDQHTGEFRFDIGFLASRLIDITQWCLKQHDISDLSLGYFGASTGGGAALVAAAKAAALIKAIVSRGGRPDLAGDSLALVKAPTLLIVGGQDEIVIEMNQTAMTKMNCPVTLEIVPGATHLFEEPGTLVEVARLAITWFTTYLNAP